MVQDPKEIVQLNQCKILNEKNNLNSLFLF